MHHFLAATRGEMAEEPKKNPLLMRARLPRRVKLGKRLMGS
jgi:hypothetical protein